MITTLIIFAIAYLIGSVSTSILLAKVEGKKDPRESGSGNAGATNVLRTSGKRDAIIVLVGDILKGVIAVWLAKAGGLHGFALGLAGFCCVVGHVFPCYFKFKGGKGVATALGVIFCLSLSAGIIALVVFAVIVFITKYVSLASIIAACTSPFILAIFSHASYFFPAVFIAVLIVWKHKANIDRLKNKTESKISFKSS